MSACKLVLAIFVRCQPSAFHDLRAFLSVRPSRRMEPALLTSMQNSFRRGPPNVIQLCIEYSRNDDQQQYQRAATSFDISRDQPGTRRGRQSEGGAAPG